ncbi:hypothetical protein [Neptunicella sp. SCSIO 80796]|uniref:hypothetical protein n=1 Tax=Neptunicella plasticusilytica TaxID=3117012 RepID=UPI003A4DC3F7
MQPSTRYQIRIAIAFTLIFILFQGIYSTSALISYKDNSRLYALNLETRIALDLPWLQLANEQMKQVANATSVRLYMDNMNQQFVTQHAPVRINALQKIQVTEEIKGQELLIPLVTPERTVPLKIVILPFRFADSFSPLSLLASLLLVYLSRRQLKLWGTPHSDNETDNKPRPKLIINLHERTLTNSFDNRTVQLSNKPFCFYIALLDYCLRFDNAALNHNKNLPTELLELANRYFYRLIELGHTIRKRPDFSSNLDKMLSEIRAALEEIYQDCPDLKAPYYPPKAQGEGSRSKLHNYALEQLTEDGLEFIGK